MKKTIVISLLLTTNCMLYAQLKNCSQCAVTTYAVEDIATNSLHELRLLRNEIFARHQYIFKNQRLEEYFLAYDWYTPTYTQTKELNFTTIEEANITLFKTQEKNIKEKRIQLLTALKKLKTAVIKNDVLTVHDFMNNSLPAHESVDGAMLALASIVSKIELEDINWYKNKALYKIEVDNGLLIHSIQLAIVDNEVIIMEADRAHSEIITKPFEYGSTYYSESEYTSLWIFIFTNNRLVLKKHVIAG